MAFDFSSLLGMLGGGGGGGGLPKSTMSTHISDMISRGLGTLYGGITTGNWGGTSKERKNQIHDIRTLRRREYQDMVHSLTEAGLNPILAVGATPGHASAYQVAAMSGGGEANRSIPGAVAANKIAEVAGKKAPSEIDKNKATTGLLGVQGENEMYRRAGILQQWDINSETIDSIRQQTKTNAALAQKYRQDAITGGASARQIDAEINALEKFGPGQTSWAGMLRAALARPEVANTAAQAGKFLDMIGGAAQRERGGDY